MTNCNFSGKCKRSGVNPYLNTAGVFLTPIKDYFLCMHMVIGSALCVIILCTSSFHIVVGMTLVVNEGMGQVGGSACGS